VKKSAQKRTKKIRNLSSTKFIQASLREIRVKNKRWDGGAARDGRRSEPRRERGGNRHPLRTIPAVAKASTLARRISFGNVETGAFFVSLKKSASVKKSPPARLPL
jgi:hypothetical protein